MGALEAIFAATFALSMGARFDNATFCTRFSYFPMLTDVSTATLLAVTLSPVVWT
jgi:hypothetical protein